MAWMLLAEATNGSTGVIVQSVVGAAALGITGMFIRYILKRDEFDRSERHKLAEANVTSHKACEETISKIVDRHEASMTHCRNDFREMLKELKG